MKNKLFTILTIMFCDREFRHYIKEEYHIFYSYLRDMYGDIDGETWDEVAENVANNEYAAPYINMVYKELEDWC